MKITCPSCQSTYQIDDSKIPDKGIHGRCPKCQQRFLIKKETNAQEKPTPEQWAKDFLKEYIDAQPKAERPDVEKAIKKEENKKDPPNPLNRFFHTIRENKQKTVLFVTAGILALMLLFPPFHIVAKGNDLRIGYSFLTNPPVQYSRYAKIDAVMLLVQCMIVAVIGMICWLAFRKDEASESFKKEFIEQEKGETGVPPPTEDLRETSVNAASSTPFAQIPLRVTEQDLIDFIGANANIYFPKFKKFRANDAGIAWHWPSCLIPFWWMLYRKLYFWAFFYGVLFIALGLLSNVLLSIGILLSSIILGMFGDYIYYKHVKKKILKLKSKRPSVKSSELSNALQRAGGVNRWVRVVVIIFSLLALVGIFAAILVPQFAADKKRSPDPKESSGRYERHLEQRKLSEQELSPQPTEQELSKQRMVLHEENYKKLLADNPDRDPYVLEQGMEAIRNDPISPYNYATVDDLERVGRERIRKAAQDLSKQRMAAYEVNFKKILAANPDRDHYVLEQGMEAIRNDPIAPSNYPTVDDLETWGREKIRKKSQKSSEYKGEGCIEGDCEDGKGTYTFSDGRKYVGEFKDGKYHGQGTLTFPDGSYTMGEWKNGQSAGVLTVPARRKQKKTEVASLPQEPAKSRPSSNIIEHESTYVAYPHGVVRAMKTGLEWKAGPDRDSTWEQARSWVQSLNTDSNGWRMPTTNELRTFYKKGAGSRNMTPLLKTTGWEVWTGETQLGGQAWCFDFDKGRRDWHATSTHYNLRAFAVRSRGDG